MDVAAGPAKIIDSFFPTLFTHILNTLCINSSVTSPNVLHPDSTKRVKSLIKKDSFYVININVCFEIVTVKDAD